MTAKKTEFERLAMSGLGVLGIATIVFVAGWVAGSFLSVPHAQCIIVADERNPNPIERVDIALEEGKIQGVDVAFRSGKSIHCCALIPENNEIDGGDASNATKAPDR